MAQRSDIKDNWESRSEHRRSSIRIYRRFYILFVLRKKFKEKTKGQNEELSLVLKRPTQVAVVLRQLVRIDPQFHNEILFYQIYARPDENFARCFYIGERPPIDSVIALENVSKRGYYPCLYTFRVRRFSTIHVKDDVRDGTISRQRIRHEGAAAATFLRHCGAASRN